MSALLTSLLQATGCCIVRRGGRGEWGHLTPLLFTLTLHNDVLIYTKTRIDIVQIDSDRQGKGDLIFFMNLKFCQGRGKYEVSYFTSSGG